MKILTMENSGKPISERLQELTVAGLKTGLKGANRPATLEMGEPSAGSGPTPGDPPELEVPKAPGSGPKLDYHDLRLLREYERFVESGRPTTQAFRQAITEELLNQKIERQRRMVEANSPEGRYGLWPKGALSLPYSRPAGETLEKSSTLGSQNPSAGSKPGSSSAGSCPEQKPRQWVRRTKNKRQSETVERGQNWTRRLRTRVVESSSSEHQARDSPGRAESSPATPGSPSCESLTSVSKSSHAEPSNEALMIRELLRAAEEPDSNARVTEEPDHSDEA